MARIGCSEDRVWSRRYAVGNIQCSNGRTESSGTRTVRIAYDTTEHIYLRRSTPRRPLGNCARKVHRIEGRAPGAVKRPCALRRGARAFRAARRRDEGCRGVPAGQASRAKRRPARKRAGVRWACVRKEGQGRGDTVRHARGVARRGQWRARMTQAGRKQPLATRRGAGDRGTPGAVRRAGCAVRSAMRCDAGRRRRGVPEACGWSGRARIRGARPAGWKRWKRGACPIGQGGGRASRATANATFCGRASVCVPGPAAIGLCDARGAAHGAFDADDSNGLGPHNVPLGRAAARRGGSATPRMPRSEEPSLRVGASRIQCTRRTTLFCRCVRRASARAFFLVSITLRRTAFASSCGPSRSSLYCGSALRDAAGC